MQEVKVIQDVEYLLEEVREMWDTLKEQVEITTTIHKGCGDYENGYLRGRRDKAQDLLKMFESHFINYLE